MLCLLYNMCRVMLKLCVMLYKTCDVMLYNMSCYITHVMLCLLYNMCHVML